MKWYVVDEGGEYNVFSTDMFYDNGKYIEDNSISVDDMGDIVKVFNNESSAFDYADKLNDGEIMESKIIKMKKRITESQLRAIVSESVKKVLKEIYNPQDDIDAEKFITWAMNSKDDVMGNIYGYYGASREGNESDAKWYMDKIIFAYANEMGCEESQINTSAIEKAINEWGYYNYDGNKDEEDDNGET